MSFGKVNFLKKYYLKAAINNISNTLAYKLKNPMMGKLVFTYTIQMPSIYLTIILN